MSAHAWDSPLALHAVSPNGINNFEIPEPPVDERTNPTGEFAEYVHPYWHAEDPENYPGKTETEDVPQHRVKAGETRAFAEYEIHEPEQNAYGDWAAISISDQYYLLCDFYPAGGHGRQGMSVAWFTSDDIWVETVKVQMGIDITDDGVVNQWSDWLAVREQYDYIEGFAKQIERIPAKLNLTELPEGYDFQFEVKFIDTTENE